MTTDPKNPAPISDSETVPVDPADDHKVAENPPAEDYEAEESGE